MYRRQKQPQHLQPQQPNFPKSENPAYDAGSVYDEIIDLDKETNEAYDHPYDEPDDGSFYDELTDPDKKTNETYDHPNAVPDRSTSNPYQELNTETTKPIVAVTTPVYLELIDVDEEKNETDES